MGTLSESCGLPLLRFVDSATHDEQSFQTKEGALAEREREAGQGGTHGAVHMGAKTLGATCVVWCMKKALR